MQYGYIFQYALLYLLHAVVVAVENPSSAVQVEVVLRILVPRQRNDCLQISHLHAVVRALRIEVVELLHLLVEEFPRLFRPFLGLRLLHELLALRTTALVAEFLLNVLYLLVEEVVALLSVQVLMRFLPDILHQPEQLVLAA